MASRRAATEARANIFFLVYANLGPDRSLMRVHETASLVFPKPPSLKTLKTWSSRFGWNQRARDFDRRLVDRAIEESGERVLQMNLRQAQLGRALQGVAGQALQTLAARAAQLTGHETARLAKEGVHIERLAEGQATDRFEVALEAVTVIIGAIASLFVEINGIEDRDARREAFAAGADRIVREHFPEIAEGRPAS